MIFDLDKMTKLAAPFYAHFHDSPETMSFGFRVYACGSMPGEALRWWTAQDRSVRSRHSYVLHRALRGSARLKLSSRKEWIDLQAGHYWLVLPGEPVVYFSRTFKQVTGRKPSDYHRGQVSASS